MQAPAGRCLNLFQATRAPKLSNKSELILSPDKDIKPQLTSWLFDVFDVDGVVLDFESSFIKVVGDYFKLEVPENYQPENWFFSDLLTWDLYIIG